MDTSVNANHSMYKPTKPSDLSGMQRVKTANIP